MNPQKPVAAGADTRNWLTRSIDVAATEAHLTLTFHGPEDQSATIRFNATQLRQWLSILHGRWMKTAWSPLVWPDWIKREESAPQDIVVH